jgi:hypothetical protein
VSGWCFVCLAGNGLSYWGMTRCFFFSRNFPVYGRQVVFAATASDALGSRNLRMIVLGLM